MTSSACRTPPRSSRSSRAPSCPIAAAAGPATTSPPRRSQPSRPERSCVVVGYREPVALGAGRRLRRRPVPPPQRPPRKTSIKLRTKIAGWRGDCAANVLRFTPAFTRIRRPAWPPRPFDQAGTGRYSSAPITQRQGTRSWLTAIALAASECSPTLPLDRMFLTRGESFS